MAKGFKRGVNFYLYYLSIPVFFFFFLLNYFSREVHLEFFNINLMISVTTFLFGFLVNITFSILLSRSASLREALSFETGRLVSLFHLSKRLGKEFHNRIIERIDNYTILTLKNYTDYSFGRKEAYAIYDDLNLVDKDKINSQEMTSFLYILGEFNIVREKLESLTSSKLLGSIKFLNYSLGSILIILLFLNRGDKFTNALFIILSTAIVFILLIIEDYDDLRIGNYTINISNAEQLFDMIGKDRYYPEEILGQVNLIEGKTYRIGVIDKKTGVEKIVSIKYEENNFLYKIKKAYYSNKRVFYNNP